jgi:hypothetical protein
VTDGVRSGNTVVGSEGWVDQMGIPHILQSHEDLRTILELLGTTSGPTLARGHDIFGTLTLGGHDGECFGKSE